MHIVINMDQVQQRVQELLAALIDFSVRKGAPRCYQNWTPETLSDYFCFHARQGTLAWVTNKGTGIGGTCVAWQINEAVLRAADALPEQYRFDWSLQDPNGDSVFFADVVCDSAGALMCLLATYAQRFPRWQHLKWFTYRRGKLVQLQRRHLNLFLRKAQNYVECESAQRP